MSLVVQLINHVPFKQLELDNAVICHPINFERPEMHSLPFASEKAIVI